MKRLFILASAATLLLASCVKTHVVYNDAPQEIGFKAVSGVMTKAEDTQVLSSLGESKNSTMGVFAYVTKEENQTMYFENAEFKYNDTDSYWTGNKYWPLGGETVQFTVYSPHNKSVTYYHEAVSAADAGEETTSARTLTINVDNSLPDSEANQPAGQADETEDKVIKASDQTDWLYGKTQPTGTKTYESVSVQLAHALAMIEVHVKGTNATLKKVEILNTTQKGTVTVTYTSSGAVTVEEGEGDGDTSTSPTVNCTADDSDATVESFIIYKADETTATAEGEEEGDDTGATGSNDNGVLNQTTPKEGSLLVFPTASLSKEAIKLTYTLDGSSTELTYTTAIEDDPETSSSNALGQKWETGKKYVYDITITPNEIKFNPTVVDWAEGNITAVGEGTDVSINQHTDPASGTDGDGGEEGEDKA